jgi:hypothetical protein
MRTTLLLAIADEVFSSFLAALHESDCVKVSV